VGSRFRMAGWDSWEPRILAFGRVGGNWAGFVW